METALPPSGCSARRTIMASAGRSVVLAGGGRCAVRSGRRAAAGAPVQGPYEPMEKGGVGRARQTGAAAPILSAEALGCCVVTTGRSWRRGAD